MSLYWQDSIKVCYHPAKFSRHIHSGIGDIGDPSLPGDLTRPRDQKFM